LDRAGGRAAELVLAGCHRARARLLSTIRIQMRAPSATIRQQCITRDRAARALAQTAYRQYSVGGAWLPVIPVTLHLLRRRV